MKRVLFVVFALLWVDSAVAFDRENWFSSRGVRAFGQALTEGGLFGVPRYTTALLPSCTTAQTGAMAYDTTLGSVVRCNGTTWGSVGGISASDNLAFTGTVSVIDGNFTIIGSADATKKIRFEVDGLTTANTRVLTPPDADITLAGQNFANVFSANQTFRDNLFTLTDDSDNTKVLNFQLSSISTGTTRTLTVPNANGTVTLDSLAATFSATKTFSASPGANFNAGSSLLFGTLNSGLGWNTASTPDTLLMMTSTISEAVNFAQIGDFGAAWDNGPCGTSACTNPHLNVRGPTVNSDYSSHSFAGITGKATKTLTEGAATDVMDVTVAAEAGTSGTLLATVYATDGSTPQVRHIRVQFAATNDGGTTTCTLGTPEEIDHTPTGTLTATVTCVDGTAALTLQINATSDLTQTTLEAYSQVFVAGPGQALPQ